MAVRPPKHLSDARLLPTGLDTLAAEIAGEKADALARTGRAVSDALDRLRAAAPDAPERAELAKAAAGRVQGYFIQRELMGFRRHAEVIESLGIPPEVLAKVGAV